MNLQILPLAITMMAGPQIMTALILTTSKWPVASSGAFVGAVGLTASVGVWLYSRIGQWLGGTVPLHEAGGPSGAAKLLQVLLVLVLIVLALRSYRGRKTSQAPKWMASLFGASPGRAFLLGCGLIFFMPTDIVVMLTVGLNLASNNLDLLSAVPFLLLTTLIAALPLISYLLFYKRAAALMPKVRDWMQRNSWLVNIFVYALFIYLIV